MKVLLTELFAPVPIARAKEGLVLIAGRVRAEAEPLAPLSDGLRGVAYHLRWSGGDETRLVPFWIEDETGRAYVKEGPLRLEIPVEEIALPADPQAKYFSAARGDFGGPSLRMETYRLQLLREGAPVYAVGRCERVPDPSGDAGLYRDPPTVPRLRGQRFEPLVVSTEPIVHEALAARIARVLRRVFGR